jgi:hypothetical protein
MMKKQYMITLILILCLATTLFITASAQFNRDPTQPSNESSPRPFSTETDVLLLRGTKATSGDDTDHYLLIDEDMPYPSQNVPVGTYSWREFEYKRWDYEVKNTKILLITQIYKETFIYDRLPADGYIISGMPTVSLAFNVTSAEQKPTYTLFFYADLYKCYSISDPETSWTEIVDFGDYTRTYPATGHNKNDWQTNIWFGKSLEEPIYIASDEKLALQVTVVGSCGIVGGIDVKLEFLHAMNTDEFLLSIPVQYEGSK